MYTPTIGLEVHAELKTKSKMFCSCQNDPHASKPNTHTCPICMGHPGTLPTPNKEAVKNVLLFGVAVGGQCADYSEFDRKNYFYPDIPKAYQLSQYAYPLVTGGALAGVQLTRVHLEEDTARSQHDKGDYSLVDYNRAGVPLMELVTEPVIHSAAEAGAFARELQLLLRTVGISEANMEKGEMRVEANISVSTSEQFGTKVEVKNLNSFRSVESAITFEINRQIELLESGGAVHQETRGWDEQKLETYLQRSKETAKDYRYFPDPDIPKIKISEIEEFSLSRLNDIMPVLPQEKRIKYRHLGLTPDQIEQIITDTEFEDFFQTIQTTASADNIEILTLTANYLLSDISAIRKEVGFMTILPPKQFSLLMSLVHSKKITSRVAKDLIKEFYNDAMVDIEAIVKERSLEVVQDEESLQIIIRQIIADNESVVLEYKAGKEASLKFLIGQGMKRTSGAADPNILKSLLEKELA